MTGKNRSGFSLFEMLIVVAIMGVLAISAVPVAEITYIKGKETELEQSLEQIRQAIKLFKRDCRNAVAQQYGYSNLIYVPDSALYPASLTILMKPDLLPGGIFLVKATSGPDSGTIVAEFYPKKYLEYIPEDPFVGRAAWLVHYASGTTPAEYDQGEITDPADHVGIFDVSCVDNSGGRRKGFVQAIDGTNYVDW